MNLVKLNEVKTMTSQEIAKLAGKEHKHVLRDIRSMLDELYLPGGMPNFEHTYVHPQNGQCYAFFKLDREHTDCLLTGYSAKARMMVIKRWQELEAQQAPTFEIPSTLSGALMLAAKQAEQIEQQQAQLALAAPKVEFVDSFVTASSGSMGFREVCKLLNVKESTFRKFLESEKIVYKLSGGKMPYANHMDAG